MGLAGPRSSKRWLALAVAAATAIRFGVFVFAMFVPIPNEQGDLVSPLLPQRYLDFQFYLDSLARYAASLPEVAHQFVDFYRAPFSDRVPGLISGPVFPLVIGVSGFSSGAYLPLGIAYLVLGSALAILWLGWLHKHGVQGPWLVAFALLPNSIWFTLVISPDLLFAAEFAAFFWAYFATGRSRWQTVGWVTALVLMILTRPNSFSVMLFVALDVAWTLLRGRSLPLTRAAALLVLLLVSGVYLFPYFVFEMNKAGNLLTYFGYTPVQYLDGIYTVLPEWLDRLLSWVSLLGAKLLYLTGLRPSYGITPWGMVLLRGAAGLVLLPGLVVLLWTAPMAVRALVALYCLPFILGPAQDRYYIAVYPLLYLYGVRGWMWAARALAATISPDASTRRAAPK